MNRNFRVKGDGLKLLRRLLSAFCPFYFYAMRSLFCPAVLFFLMTFLSACQSNDSIKNNSIGKQETRNLKYARLFTIDKHDSYRIITVKNPWDSTRVYASYVLVPKGQKNPENLPENAVVVQTPIKNISTLSSTHIGLLELLRMEDKLIGHSDLGYVYNRNVRKLIEEGKLKETGQAQNLNIEAVIDLNPDLLMASGMEKVNENLRLIEQSNIPVAYNIEWMEESPLGRAEWIKFMAEFFNKRQLADSIFNVIELEYIKVRNLVKNSIVKPVVLAGNMYKGTWFMPGGKSYTAQFLKDAGAEYYWFEDQTSGSIPLSFEVVLDKQMNSDIWINPGGAKKISELSSLDSRYKMFAPYVTGKVYNMNRKVSHSGANDYWESGLVNPHLILKDLIAIFHPELLPDHQWIYYQKLK